MEKGEQYAKLYVELLRKLQRVDTVQAVLVAITDMLTGEIPRIPVADVRLQYHPAVP